MGFAGSSIGKVGGALGQRKNLSMNKENKMDANLMQRITEED
jgi:hypothetical protein